MNLPKYVWMLLLAGMTLVQGVSAQDNKGKPKDGQKPVMSWEEMQEMQSDFIVQTLVLDDKTAEKFKQIYKEYAEELRNLMPKQGPGRGRKGSDAKKGKGENGEWKAPTDEEVERMIKGRFAQSRKMLDLHEKYYDRYRKILSPKQIQKVYDLGMMNAGRVQQEINRRHWQRGAHGPHHPWGQPQGPQ